MGQRTARLLGGLGRALITLGVLVILFAGYQLWGTGLAEQRAQDDLEASFAERRDALWATSTTTAPPTTAPATTAPPTTTTTPTTSPAGPAPPATTAPTTVPAPAPVVVAPELAEELQPDLGETVGRIVMPTIGVDKFVVHGVRRSDLRRGPGHYPDSPLPGQAGNAAIAGHRTTYGAPFGDLDDLQPGDTITVETLQGTFHYEVMGHTRRDGTTVGHVIVGPDAVEVLDDFGDNRLTLTACHPKFSAAQRIVVTAQLVTPPAPEVQAAEPPPEVDAAEPPPATEPSPVEPGAPGPSVAGGGTQPAPVGDGGEGHPAAPDGDGADPEPAAGPDGREGGEEADGSSDDAMGETLGWDTGELPATAGWAAVTAALAAAVAAVGRLWRRWPARLLGAPLVAVALFVTFGHLDRMMPAL